MAKTPEYRAYCNARTRCRYKGSPYYKNYGGRGIEFRFRSFEEFLQELGPKLKPELTVDRINNDGHYEPGNVRWASRSEQKFNVRRQFMANKTHKLQIPLDPAVFRQLKQFAEGEDLPITAVVRRVIREFLATQEESTEQVVS